MSGRERLIVPGRVRPVRKALTVVRDHRRRPVGLCRLCRTLFYEGEERAYERHVVRCGNEHEQTIHEMSPRTRLPLLTPEGGPDPELEHWIDENRKDLIEGRKRI